MDLGGRVSEAPLWVLVPMLPGIVGEPPWWLSQESVPIVAPETACSEEAPLPSGWVFGRPPLVSLPPNLRPPDFSTFLAAPWP